MSRMLGKNFAIGGHPNNFPASKKTMWMLNRASKGEVKYANPNQLTQGEAFELLSEYRSGRREPAKDVVRRAALSPITQGLYAQVTARAIHEANKAGLAWVKRIGKSKPSYFIYDEERDRETPVYGRLGFARVEIVDKLTPFAQWVGEQNGLKDAPQYFFIDHAYQDRRELGCHRACTLAAIVEFRRNGVQGIELSEVSY